MINKAFTLVELLAVLVILGLLSIITIAALNNVLKNSKDSLYETQIENIKEAARKWVVKNSDRISEFETCKLKLDTLATDGYLPTSTIVDPRNKNYNLCGPVEITYDSNRGKYYYRWEPTSQSSCPAVSNDSLC